MRRGNDDEDGEKELQQALRRWATELVLELPRDREQALTVLDEAARLVQQYYHDELRASARICTRAGSCVACSAPGRLEPAPPRCFASLARSLQARDNPPDNLVQLKRHN